jgi:hypothetical protein
LIVIQRVERIPRETEGPVKGMIVIASSNFKKSETRISPRKDVFLVFQHRQDIFTTGKIAHSRYGSVRKRDTRSRLKPDEPP